MRSIFKNAFLQFEKERKEELTGIMMKGNYGIEERESEKERAYRSTAEVSVEEKMSEEMSLWEKGMSTVEVILILVVLVALVLIFKDQITALVETVFESINKTAASIY